MSVQLLKVLFVPLHDIRGASSRYRVYQYVAHLERYGIMPIILRVPTENRIAEMSKLVQLLYAARQVDVVFIQKRLFNHRVLSLIQRANDRIVYDFDDAIYSASAPFEVDPSILSKTRRNLTAILHQSKLVIAGNDYLASYARQHNRSVVVMATAIDTDRFAYQEEPPAKELVIGWIGNSENLHYLQTLQGVFALLAHRYGKNVLLRVVSGGPYSSRGALKVDNQVWTLESEIQHLRSFHIGVSPLTDDEWTRGKCGFRALQYMAVGIPAVVSPVGVNRDIVNDGVNGFLAESEDEWFAKLSQLIENRELRRRFGQRGRSIVERDYSLSATLPKLAAALKSAADL